jgi:EpsI family protein
MKRGVATLIILAITAALHTAISRNQQASAASTEAPALFDIPSQIIEFRQARPDAPIPESLRQELETNTILMRDYLAPDGRPVQLTIVHAGTSRRSLHFPEVCFTGQGWETADKFLVPIGVYFVGQGLLVQKGDNREAVLYWFKTGGDSTASYLMNTLYWSRDTLMMRDPGSQLIRLSTPIGDDGEERAFRVLSDFASGLVPLLASTEE